MAERDDITHAELRRLVASIRDELDRNPGGVRRRLHDIENMLTAHKIYVEMVPGLVAWKHWTMGAAIGASAAVSAVTAIAVRMLG